MNLIAGASALAGPVTFLIVPHKRVRHHHPSEVLPDHLVGRDCRLGRIPDRHRSPKEAVVIFLYDSATKKIGSRFLYHCTLQRCRVRSGE